MFRVRVTAALLIFMACSSPIPVFAQNAQPSGQLSLEEKVAAQNFNGIDIVGDSLGTASNNAQPSMMNSKFGQVAGLGNQFNSGLNMQNNSSNSGSQNSFSSQMNGQNPQLGQMNAADVTNEIGMNNGFRNQGANIGTINASEANAANSINVQPTGGGLLQTLGSNIMNDPKTMQRALGVAGAAAIFGVMMGGGGVGGMMRSAGFDNTRHVRGPGGGY